jgi:hypothetical protein
MDPDRFTVTLFFVTKTSKTKFEHRDTRKKEKFSGHRRSDPRHNTHRTISSPREDSVSEQEHTDHRTGYSHTVQPYELHTHVNIVLYRTRDLQTTGPNRKPETTTKNVRPRISRSSFDGRRNDMHLARERPQTHERGNGKQDSTTTQPRQKEKKKTEGQNRPRQQPRERRNKRTAVGHATNGQRPCPFDPEQLVVLVLYSYSYCMVVTPGFDGVSARLVVSIAGTCARARAHKGKLKSSVPAGGYPWTTGCWPRRRVRAPPPGPWVVLSMASRRSRPGGPARGG